MRRIVVYNWMTADGYFAGPDGSLDWVKQDKDIDRDAMASRSKFDTVLLGRRTYELMAAFWAHALDDPSTKGSPHGDQPLSPDQRAMAVFLNDAKKIVFSKSLKKPEWKNTRVMEDIDPGKIEELKRERGDDMILFGSGSVVTRLTEQRLIDEYQFVVCPVILGSGRSMISGSLTRLKLDLKDAKKYSSGNIMLRYTPA